MSETELKVINQDQKYEATRDFESWINIKYNINIERIFLDPRLMYSKTFASISSCHFFLHQPSSSCVISVCLLN